MSVAEPSPSRLDWLPYVAPMAAFLIGTSLEDYLPRAEGGAPSPTWYPVAYAIKMAIVTGVMIACRSTWCDLRPIPGPGTLALGVSVGLGVTAAWVGLDGLYPALPFLGGTRAGFDPDVLPTAARVGFLAVRLYGLVLVVPMFEELFWRSFGIRYVIDPDFARVPIGRVTPTAAVATSVVFAIAHPVEWLPALLTGLAWAWLVHRTKSLAACVVSHAVANLGLGIYVLTTRAWKFW